MANAENCRLVSQWLEKIRILPPPKVTQPARTAAELGAMLSDGVYLCRLLTTLNPNSLTVSDYNPYPHNSEYMASRNILKFLSVCKYFFKLADSDLFEVDDLLHLNDFDKVLNTLSVLSRSPCALTGQSTVLHLTASEQTQDSEYSESNGNGTAEEFSDFDCESDYVNVLDYESETSERIYESVVHRAEPGRKRPSSALESLLAEPKTKCEHCLRELLEKEANYVQALGMLHNNFIVLLRDKLRPDVRDVIFKHIEELYRFHERLLTALNDAVLGGGGSNSVPDVFLRNRMSFALYGAYCANLPLAQAKIIEACRDPTVATEITKCEMLDPARFRLSELLTVPMQRVLKYPLMLRELAKHSAKNAVSTPAQQQAFECAIDAMQDVAAFINECKRDAELAHTVEGIIRSIDALARLADTARFDYGRFCKDGELRVAKAGIAKSADTRYVFLFEKSIVLCKRKRGGDRFFGGQTCAFKFKESIALEKYKLLHALDQASTARGRAKTNDKRTAPFHLEPVNDSKELASFTLIAKNDVERETWIQKISDAIGKVSPPGARAHGRTFVYTTFAEPSLCHVCCKLLLGTFHQGYHCARSGVDAHSHCIADLAAKPFFDVPAPSLLVSVVATSTEQHGRSTTSENLPLMRANIDAVVQSVARIAYNGNPLPPGSREPLGFQELETVEITLAPLESDWYEGRIGDRKGWFPREFVEIILSGGNSISLAHTEHASEKLAALSKLYRNRKLSTIVSNPPAATPSGPTSIDRASNGHTVRNRPRPSISCISSTRSGASRSGIISGNTPRSSKESGRSATDNDLPQILKVERSELPADQQAPDLQGYSDSWFGGPVDRLEAEIKLRDCATGTFLIRQRVSAPYEFAVSVQYRDKVKHILILRSDGDGVRPVKWFLCEQRQFESIPELVEYYETNSLCNAFSDIDCTLAHPFFKQPRQAASLAVAVYDYNSSDHGQLSFVTGDRIEVLSKLSDDRGWWHGRLNGRSGFFPKAYVSEENTLAS